MSDTAYVCPSQSVVYRKVKDELVVIPLKSGRFYYFNPEAENFLNFFRQPRRLSDFRKAVKIEVLPEEEQKYLDEFISRLKELEILRESERDLSEPSFETQAYSRPRFLRQGDRTLADVAFMYP